VASAAGRSVSRQPPPAGATADATRYTVTAAFTTAAIVAVAATASAALPPVLLRLLLYSQFGD